MNQTTISPKENVTLLLVAVPKGGTDHYLSHEDHQIYYYKNGKLTATNSFPFGRISFLPEYIIIGLSQNITEEQAKELVGKLTEVESILGELYFTSVNRSVWTHTAKEAIDYMIQNSGLTIGKDQDCLILKLN